MLCLVLMLHFCAEHCEHAPRPFLELAYISKFDRQRVVVWDNVFHLVGPEM